MASPLVGDVRRLSLDDGPGLRTTVFLKGCPLSCTWCHNPEFIRPGRQLFVETAACLRCADCLPACPRAAVVSSAPPVVDRDRCTVTGACAAACPAGALRVVGRAMTVDELVGLLLRDRAFYDASGGGVTFSGGEPTMFPEFLGAVLRRLQEGGIHTALETAGGFAWGPFADEVAPFVDLVLFDLKLIDDGEHRRYVGAGNAPILDNFARLCEVTSIEVIPRTPLIPGITDTRKNLAGIARFVAQHRCAPWELLPYNPAGHAKRRALGETAAGGLRDGPMTRAEIAAAEAMAAGVSVEPT